MNTTPWIMAKSPPPPQSSNLLCCLTTWMKGWKSATCQSVLLLSFVYCLQQYKQTLNVHPAPRSKVPVHLKQVQVDYCQKNKKNHTVHLATVVWLFFRSIFLAKFELLCFVRFAKTQVLGQLLLELLRLQATFWDFTATHWPFLLAVILNTS